MKTYQHFSCGILLLSMLPSASVQAAADLEKAMANPNNWAHARGQYNNQGYSKLNQINTKNVKQLKMAWTFSTGVPDGNQGAPLVIGNMMYVHTAFPNHIYALDLDHDQKIVWSYHPRQDKSVKTVLCCSTVTRGLAYGDGKIFLQQNDGKLVALNAKHGHKLWTVQVTNPKEGASNTNAPMVVKDKVLTGCAGGEYGVRCFMAAYYLKNGALAWKAYSTGPDSEVLISEDFNRDNPQYSALSVYEDINGGNVEGGSFKPIPNDQLKINESNLGIRTWLKPQAVKDGWQHSGSAVTGYFAYDKKTNLVYYGTGNPSVRNPDVRPGDNKWANSVFARDVDTGHAKWAMQTTPHDEWFYSATNELILFKHQHKTYTSQINKNGFVYTWQANNGNLIVAKKVLPFVNWATSVDLKTGVPVKTAKYNTHQDVNSKDICPTSWGAKSIAPAAYSITTKLIFATLNVRCMSFEPVKIKYERGKLWADLNIFSHSGPDGKSGAVIAINPLNGMTKWVKKYDYAFSSGVLATAGNLILYGTADRWFKILNTRNGDLLWKFRVGAGISANPFTYSHKGKQFVGILSGNSSMHSNQMRDRFRINRTSSLPTMDKSGQLYFWSPQRPGSTLNIFSL